MDNTYPNSISFAPAPPSPTTEVFTGYRNDIRSTESDLNFSTSSLTAESSQRLVVSPSKRDRRVSSKQSGRNEKRKRPKTQKSTRTLQTSSEDADPDTTEPQYTDFLPSLTPALPIESSDYKAYVEYALTGAAGFHQISSEVFIAQGWDPRSTSTTVCVYCDNNSQRNTHVP